MNKINELIKYQWNKYEEKKDLKEQLSCSIFVVLFITLFFTMMVLKSVYGG